MEKTKIVVPEKLQEWLDKGWRLSEGPFTDNGKEYKTNGQYYTFGGRLVYKIIKED